MNFAFSEEQEFLRSTAREFLENECPSASVREWMETPSGYDAELWRKLAELGWVGLLIPEEFGGAGLGLVDAVVVLEELGRALLPSPYLANLQGSLAVLKAGSDTQKKELLPAVATGERILSFAITEQAGTEEPDAIEARAEGQGAALRITGTKLFVPDGQNADTLVVLVRTGGSGAGGLSLALVDRTAPGVEVIALDSIDQTRRIAEVRFENAPGELLGERDAGFGIWEYVRDRTYLALAADAVGGAEKTLEASVAYAKERVQFGKPIGVHQAIKHKCADMLVAVESSKSLTYYAAWALDSGAEDGPLVAAMAKAYTADAYRQTSADNIQIHGGVGFTWEYDCHLYFKRAKSDEVTYGDPTRQRERVASLLNL